MSSLIRHYSASDIETRILDGLRDAGLNPDNLLDPEAIAALDHFHTGGLQSSIELIELAAIGADERVLDIGAGLGGCARLIAASEHCQVECVELSPDYCTGARLLNRLTGLDDRILVHEGSALALPCDDAAFDVVWMQNVGMNIEDKAGLYAEIFRVLKPGGRYAMQDMAAGKVPVSFYPLPWASSPRDNHLVSMEQMHQLMADAGLVQDVFEDISEHDFATNARNATPAGQGKLGLGVFVDDLALKASNAVHAMKDGMVHLVRGLYHRPLQTD